MSSADHSDTDDAGVAASAGSAANPGASEPTASGPKPGSGRLVLLLIAGIPVTIVLASSWLWYFVAQGDLDLVGRLGTANSGDLLQPPRQASDSNWTNANGELFTLGDKPQWTLVVPQRSASCDTRCEHLLFETRQIHTLLAKEMGRVKRALVTTAVPDAMELSVSTLSDDRPLPADFSAYVAQEQRGLTIWQSGRDEFSMLFSELANYPGSWYLMDPNGWVMMRYDDSIHYKDVISDLKFLLKNSNG